ncbi:unnamed protein product, partial [Rotaria socialis]
MNDDAQCSAVVKHFFLDLYINLEKNRWSSKCKTCSSLITDTYKTTSNFLKHLKTKHRALLDEWKNNQGQPVKDRNQPKINNVFSPDGEKYSSNNIRQQQLTNSIIKNLIINMGLPLSIVDHTSFKKFMTDVDPKFKPIHRRDLTRTFLPNLQKKCVLKLKEICNQSSYVSLTLDVWTDRRMRSYLGVTLHTIINDELKSFLLAFDRLEGKHTSEKLATEFDRIIQLYDIKDKIVRLITDNASNNLAAFDNIILPGFEDYFDELQQDEEEKEVDSESESNDELNDDLVDKEKQFQIQDVDDTVYQTSIDDTHADEYLRLPCFIHCLQLVVNDGIKSCTLASSSLKKVASLAKLAHCSTEFAERLSKVNYSIPRANRTRWNSQYQTVKKVINIPSSTLNSILNDLKKNELIINTKDRKILEEFVSLFELFNEATLVTQGENFVTISLAAPTILGILFDLERELNSSSLVLTSLCETLISSIKARFSGLLRHFDYDVPFGCYSMSERFSDPIFLIAPLFDTRFKLLWLENLHSSNEAAEVPKINELSSHDVSIKIRNLSVKRKCLFPYFGEVKKISHTDKSKILTELDQYLCEENSKENLIFEKKHLYPCLYQLGLKYLSVPATSAPVERIFSQGGFVMRPHRASLTPKNVCLLTFLKSTRAFTCPRIVGTRTRTRTRIGGTRTRTRTRIGGTRTRTRTRIGGTRTRTRTRIVGTRTHTRTRKTPYLPSSGACILFRGIHASLRTMVSYTLTF